MRCSTTCASGSGAPAGRSSRRVSGWEFGADFGYLRELCDALARRATTGAQTERALNGLPNWRWEGIHVIWERAARRARRPRPSACPILLIHGWPGAPIEFLA